MLKGLVIGVLATILAAGAGGYLIVTSGIIPANADGQPLPLETWAASVSLDATVDRLAPKEANPVALTNENLTIGVELYGRHCAVCHGTAKGAESASPIAKGEFPPPPQFAADGVEDDSEGASFWKIKHGIRLTGMPAWKDALSDQQIWALALFLKHMDKLPSKTQQEWQRVTN